MLALLAGGAACAPAESPPLDLAAWRAGLDSFRTARHEEVTGRRGWITLTGLYWLAPGANAAGAAPGAVVRLPPGRGAESLGMFVWTPDSVTFDAAPQAEVLVGGAPVTHVRLTSDSGGRPAVLRAGSLELTLVRRPRGSAIRVHDTDHPARAAFPGFAWFDDDVAWRIPARFERHTPPKTIPILDVTGAEDDKESPGAIVFSVNGAEQRLDVLTDNDTTTYWVIFKDATSGIETYGAGRYLHVPRPDARGALVVDLNRTYNPPCAYTNFATCPLPPPQNRLTARITSGEKRYPGEAALYESLKAK